MSRRPLTPPVARLAKAQSRMAPGGRLWSETPIPRRYSPRIPMTADEPPPLPPEPTFPVPELVFSGGYYTSVETVLFTTLTWDGAVVAPTPSGVYTALPGTTGHTIEVFYTASSSRWVGVVRLTKGTDTRALWWSTLPDTDGAGPDYANLLAITRSGVTWRVHQSTDPAVPSLDLAESRVSTAYNFQAPTSLTPSGSPIPVTGSMRFAIVPVGWTP